MGVVALRVAVCIVVVRRFVGEPLYANNLKNDHSYSFEPCRLTGPIMESHRGTQGRPKRRHMAMTCATGQFEHNVHDSVMYNEHLRTQIYRCLTPLERKRYHRALREDHNQIHVCNRLVDNLTPNSVWIIRTTLSEIELIPCRCCGNDELSTTRPLSYQQFYVSVPCLGSCV